MQDFNAKKLQGIAGKATSGSETQNVKKHPNVLCSYDRLIAGALGGSGTVLGGALFNGAGLTALTSVVGAGAATIGCAAGATVLAGAAVAGAADIAYRVWNCKNTFFQEKSKTEFAVGLVTVVTSLFASMWLALKFTVFFLGYGIKAIAECICRCKSEEQTEDTARSSAEKAGEALTEACRNLAGIILFPVINLVDCAGSATGLRKRFPSLFEDSTLKEFVDHTSLLTMTS